MGLLEVLLEQVHAGYESIYLISLAGVSFGELSALLKVSLLKVSLEDGS